MARKKWKKLLALTLAMSMVLSLFNLTVLAAGGEHTDTLPCTAEGCVEGKITTETPCEVCGGDGYTGEDIACTAAGCEDGKITTVTDCGVCDGDGELECTGDFEKTGTTATCTQAGEATYVCATCGANYSEHEDALGHSWGTDVTQVTAPTCITDGTGTVGCTNDNCDATNEVKIDATGVHIWGITGTCINCTQTLGGSLGYEDLGEADAYGTGWFWYADSTTLLFPGDATPTGYSDYEAIATQVITLTSMTKAAMAKFTALKTLDMRGVIIGTEAFMSWAGPETLTLTDCTIGANAFNSCTGVKTLTLTGCKIGQMAFSGCTMEKAIMTNCEIVPWAIQLCAKLETVSLTNCTITGSGLFQGCTALTNVNLTDCTIGAYAFLYSNAPFRTLTLTNCETIGNYAFAQCSGLTTLTVKGVTSIETYAFSGCTGLTSVALEDVGSIGTYAFSGCTGLTSVTLEDIGSIGSSAFYNCSALTSVTLENVGSIGAHAFSYCSSLTELDVPADTKLGYSNCFDYSKPGFADLKDRMTALLADEFALASTPALSELTVPSGWTSSQLGEANSTGESGTQITKAARWADADSTVAEVQLQFNYDDEQGMDFIFLVDFSNSMTSIGNTETDDDSRFSAMQSKLRDVVAELLGNTGYDNRVAFVSFGGKNGSTPTTVGTSDFYDRGEDAAVVSYIDGLKPYNENTDYISALKETKDLIEGRTDTSRQPAVIFISDGAPNINASGTRVSTSDTAMHADIKAAADEIKNAGIEIFGVMQSVPAAQVADCEKAMKAVCTEELFFLAADTEEFGEAVNNAIGAAYTVHAVIDTVDPAFTLNESSIQVSAGKTEVTTDSDNNTTIIWTVYGVPYVTHTLTYTADLNQVSGSHPTGTFDTNEGDAVVCFPPEDGEMINWVATPQLSRSASSSGGGTYYNVTVNYYDQDTNESIADSYTRSRIRAGSSYDVSAYDAIAIEGYTYVETTGDPLQMDRINGNKVIDVWYVADDEEIIPDEETPTGDAPIEEEPVAVIPEPEVPLGNVPQTGDRNMTIGWLMAALASMGGLAALALTGRRRREEEEV
ncbi:MAG: leucine-rich repeat protein [Bacillota bacterium]|nr:leucine-rich repeat protein [Bacillota bacterium]